MSGLMQILKTHTYWNREHTNKHILGEATNILHPKGNKHVLLYSEFHEERNINLIGHVIGTNDNDPLRQVSLKPNSAEPINYGSKRVGRPKQSWLYEASKAVWEKMLKKDTPFTGEENHCNCIRN